MSNADISKWSPLLVDEGVVYFLKDIEAFNCFAKYCRFAVQVVKIVAQCNDELAAGQTLVRIN